jgi:diacylglycerol kinase family enzyme
MPQADTRRETPRRRLDATLGITRPTPRLHYASSRQFARVRAGIVDVTIRAERFARCKRTIKGMSTTALIVIASIAAVIVLIVAAILGIRAYRRHRVTQAVEQRDKDRVHYAFIINPSKPQAAELRQHIQEFCERKKLTQVEFIDTQLDKDGRACGLEALEHGADVLIAVGGDGTVRTVASVVSGTEHTLGIIPIGTGNLFARNMGIPIDDVDAALTVATSHGSQQVDMGRLSMLDRPEDEREHAFLIIAGIGFDALMIDDTNPELKKSISWLAYFVGAVRHLFSPKYRGTITMTGADGEIHSSKSVAFRTFMAGNCGQIPVVSLMPEAVYDDGLLDFELIDTSGGIIGWANLFGDVLHQTVVGKPGQSPLSTNSTLDQIQGISAEIELERKALAQVDGDIVGETKRIRFDVDRKALRVRVPQLEEPEADSTENAENSIGVSDETTDSSPQEFAVAK